VKALLCFCLLLSSVAIAHAVTINVPADQPTIQAAINIAKNGDTVLVAAGTYFENINFSGKAITVKSSGGNKVTIIDGGHLNPVVTFSTNESPKSRLQGFTIQNGMNNSGFGGGGIVISNASPVVTGNIITHNTAANGGGGISLNGSSAVVQGNTISFNSQSPGFSGGVGGGGIEIGGGSAQIIGNVVQNNTWGSGSGGGITLFGAGPVLRNNVIKGNVATGVSPYSQGGGIWIVNSSDALIVQNLIYNNSAGQGSGIYFLVPFGDRGPVLVNNTIVGTASSLQGSAVYASGFYDQVALYNNLMIGATGTSALFCDSTYDQTPPSLINNDGFSLTGIGIAGACTPQSGLNGNISADPMLTSNFHLRVGSPVIDAGLNSAPGLLTNDLAGSARIVDADNDGDGPIIDMGAYEYPN
jgi:hypothetical protein